MSCKIKKTNPLEARGESGVQGPFARLGDFVPPVVLVIGFLACTTPWILLHTDDLRLLKAFNTDEHFVVTALECMFEQSTIVVNRCVPYRLDWPRLLFYLDLGVIYPSLAVLPHAVRTFIVVPRLVVLSFGLMSLLATYFLGSRMFNRAVGFLSGVLLITTGVFLHVSLIIHPDIVQLFFILFALFFCYELSEHGKWWSLITASISAGLAFGSKLAGAHILPIIGLACVLYLYNEKRPSSLSDWLPLIGNLILRCIVAAVVFLLVFVVVTPELILAPGVTLEGLTRGATQMQVKGSGGIVGNAQLDPIRWLNVMMSSNVMGFAVLLFTGLGFCVMVRWIRKDKMPDLRRGHIVVFVWPILFVGSLMGLAGYINQAHLVPVIPIVFIFTAYVLLYPPGKWRFETHNWRWKLASVVAIVLLILLLVIKVTATCNFLSGLTDRRESPLIAAGEWLEQSYPRDTIILHDQYVYVPVAFQKVASSWGLTREQVDLIDPDLIIVNEKFHRRFMIDQEFQHFAGGPDAYFERQNFYRGLTEGEEKPYKWVKSFGPIGIYANQHTLGVVPVIEELANDNLVYLPVEWGQQIDAIMTGHLDFLEHERSLVLPGRYMGKDAVYVLPNWEEELVEAFSKKWGDMMQIGEVSGEDDSVRLKIFRLEANRLPDVSSAREMLTEPDFPLHLHGTLSARFMTGIELLGYRLQSHTVSPNRPVRITLFWQAISDQQREDYTISAHLLNEEGQMLGQDDRRPLAGTYSTDEWNRGDVIIQRHVLPVPDDIPEGQYYLEVGMYRLADGERLALVEPAHETTVVVGPLHLIPAK